MDRQTTSQALSVSQLTLCPGTGQTAVITTNGGGLSLRPSVEIEEGSALTVSADSHFYGPAYFHGAVNIDTPQQISKALTELTDVDINPLIVAPGRAVTWNTAKNKWDDSVRCSTAAVADTIATRDANGDLTAHQFIAPIVQTPSIVSAAGGVTVGGCVMNGGNAACASITTNSIATTNPATTSLSLAGATVFGDALTAGSMTLTSMQPGLVCASQAGTLAGYRARNFTGWESWDSTPIYTLAGKSLTVAAGYGWVCGVRMHWGSQTVDTTAADGTTYLVLVNESGVLSTLVYTAASSATYMNNVVLFSVMHTASKSFVVRNNSPYEFSQPVGASWSLALGARVSANFEATVSGLQLTLPAPFSIVDRGIVDTVSATIAAPTIYSVYYSAGTGKWVSYNSANTIQSASAAGAASGTDRTLHLICLVKGDTNPAVVDVLATTAYASLANAKLAIDANDSVQIAGALAALNPVPIMWIVVNNASGTPVLEYSMPLRSSANPHQRRIMSSLADITPSSYTATGEAGKLALVGASGVLSVPTLNATTALQLPGYATAGALTTTAAGVTSIVPVSSDLATVNAIVRRDGNGHIGTTRLNISGTNSGIAIAGNSTTWGIYWASVNTTNGFDGGPSYGCSAIGMTGPGIRLRSWSDAATSSTSSTGVYFENSFGSIYFASNAGDGRTWTKGYLKAAGGLIADTITTITSPGTGTLALTGSLSSTGAVIATGGVRLPAVLSAPFLGTDASGNLVTTSVSSTSAETASTLASRDATGGCGFTTIYSDAAVPTGCRYRLRGALDHNWTLYHASPVAGTTPAGGTTLTPPTYGAVTGEAMRLRAFKGAGLGWIFENSDNTALMSIGSNTGAVNMAGTLSVLGAVTVPALAATSAAISANNGLKLSSLLSASLLGTDATGIVTARTASSTSAIDTYVLRDGNAACGFARITGPSGSTLRVAVNGTDQNWGMYYAAVGAAAMNTTTLAPNCPGVTLTGPCLRLSTLADSASGLIYESTTGVGASTAVPQFAVNSSNGNTYIAGNLTMAGSDLHIGASADSTIVSSNGVSIQSANRQVVLSGDSTSQLWNANVASYGVVLRSEATDVLRMSKSRLNSPVALATTVVTGDSVDLRIDSNGTIGIAASAAKYKEQIADMGDTSFLYEMRPVTYVLRGDPVAKRCYGLIADECEPICPDIVRKRDGEIEGLYEQFLPYMLLNELKQQRGTIQTQQSTIASLQAEVAELHAALDALVDLVKAKLQ
ncbi:hypothetical protein PAPYR_11457 [Paratrimastix pyriformis]|uniref:Peptidase S74 domain-containing protein n=1 Tax=Paratrimastix pyriformis TaxID=342808 RepID=A0ABQ8U5G9_9EUKA|nr:hypothetical protein PAPYR_11457 [Paratrimastix pyriformis]